MPLPIGIRQNGKESPEPKKRKTRKKRKKRKNKEMWIGRHKMNKTKPETKAIKFV